MGGNVGGMEVDYDVELTYTRQVVAALGIYFMQKSLTPSYYYSVSYILISMYWTIPAIYI